MTAPRCQDERCVTCGDIADPMRVVRVDAERGLALCEGADGQRHTIETALLDDVAAGDELLVHAGVAIGPAEPAGRPAEVPT